MATSLIEELTVVQDLLLSKLVTQRRVVRDLREVRPVEVSAAASTTASTAASTTANSGSITDTAPVSASVAARGSQS